jgi:hypothetical protein
LCRSDEGGVLRQRKVDNTILHGQDEQFSIEFLLDLCVLCLKSRIGEICLTPWKSLIIKGIEDQFRSEWSNISGKHNINVRHAANELAWQTEDQTEEGTALKKELVRYIEKNDTRTFGLCFGIQTRPKSEVFGSILIRRRPLLSIGQLALFSVYDLYHTETLTRTVASTFCLKRDYSRFTWPDKLSVSAVNSIIAARW